MRVVHIITGLNDGGAEAVLYRLCKYDTENIHICISLMDEGKYGPKLSELGIKVYCLNMKSNKLSFSKLWKLYFLLFRIKTDVVQTWMYHANFIGGICSRLLGIQNIIWGIHHTTLNPGETKKSTILIAKISAKLSSIIPQKIIYCAQKAREVQESYGYDISKGIVISNGYNLEDFNNDIIQRGEFRKELNIDASTFLVGHVGRFSPYKDYPNLIKSFYLLDKVNPSIKFVLVGTGLDNSNTQLSELIESFNLSDKVLLLGRRDDVCRVMNGFDLFVLSSISEAFPNVLNEAMACSTPCVTTNVGDASIIVGKTGWIVMPSDPYALSESISQAINEKNTSPLIWEKRKNDCRIRIIENFNIEKMVNSYKAVWEA
jgi:glycosyltransferase involved in cell wall biosynthesis